MNWQGHNISLQVVTLKICNSQHLNLFVRPDLSTEQQRKLIEHCYELQFLLLQMCAEMANKLAVVTVHQPDIMNQVVQAVLAEEQATDQQANYSDEDDPRTTHIQPAPPGFTSSTPVPEVTLDNVPATILDATHHLAKDAYVEGDPTVSNASYATHYKIALFCPDMEMEERDKESREPVGQNSSGIDQASMHRSETSSNESILSLQRCQSCQASQSGALSSAM